MSRRLVQAFVFVGAVLLFSLEPLVGRLLLPRFGGAFHVWTSALMFFQGALFFAYLYAHLAAGRLGPWHLAVVALPLVVLPPGVGEEAAGTGTASILALLVRHVALPFGVLATTAIVAQRWWAQRPEARDEPYGLYAISNAGSLGALLLYAIVIEPLVGLSAQRWTWTAGYVVYVVLAVLAWRSLAPTRDDAVRTAAATPRPRAATLLYFGLLSAAPSAFSMAVTNLIALDAGNIPLVWVVPLAIYLGSFVIAFAPPKEGDADESRVPRTVRRLWPHVAAVGLFFYTGGDAGGGWLDVGVHLVVLAFVTLAAHGELYRVRPAPEHLTLYYLVIAAGGWAGGAMVALVAPVAFSGLYEYPLALVILAVTMAIGRREVLVRWLRTAPRMALLVSAALVLLIVWKVAAASAVDDGRTVLAVERSFYGLYQVTRTERGDGAVRDLVSGTTRHGRQREGDRTPLSYYHADGPLGDALATLPSPRRIGVVGLGVGAAAGHLREGDAMVFYEIDPMVVSLARAHFTHLSAPGADVDVVVGDARLSLERERRRFDLLFVDAFAGDAIPTHLLTLEALRLDVSRLAPGGLLVLHISNRYYDLGPVLIAAARRLGLHGAHIARDRGLARDHDAARCVALAPTPQRVRALVEQHGWTPLEREPPSSVEPWTDDHANLFDALLARAR